MILNSIKCAIKKYSPSNDSIIFTALLSGHGRVYYLLTLQKELVERATSVLSLRKRSASVVRTWAGIIRRRHKMMLLLVLNLLEHLELVRVRHVVRGGGGGAGVLAQSRLLVREGRLSCCRRLQLLHVLQEVYLGALKSGSTAFACLMRELSRTDRDSCGTNCGLAAYDCSIIWGVLG